MEESQERDSGRSGLTPAADSAREPAATPLAVERVSYRRYVADPARPADRLLGAIAYGAHPPAEAETEDAPPAVWIPMPALGGDSFVELWLGAGGVTRSDSEGILAAHDREHLFGSLQLEDGDDLEALVESAYRRVFDCADALGFPHLLRTWNYFAGINSETGGVERYRLFNVGRQHAFAAKGRVIGENMPAASALGSRSGPLSVFFIAGREPGQPIENPRQVSAYHYPDQYGERSPAFSRAMLVSSGDLRTLFISGTASIVGHESLHVNDVTAQIHETITNLRAVLQEAKCEASGRSRLLLKAYVRRREHAATVREALAQAFPAAHIVCLKADICRSDLLAEVEAVFFERAG